MQDTLEQLAPRLGLDCDVLIEQNPRNSWTIFVIASEAKQSRIVPQKKVRSRLLRFARNDKAHCPVFLRSYGFCDKKHWNNPQDGMPNV